MSFVLQGFFVVFSFYPKLRYKRNPNISILGSRIQIQVDPDILDSFFRAVTVFGSNSPLTTLLTIQNYMSAQSMVLMLDGTG